MTVCTPAAPRRAFLQRLALAAAPFAPAWARAAEAAVKIPPPAQDLPPGMGMQKAVFAGGCFWGVQGVFQHVKGVRRAVSGYSGGSAANAAYELVSGGGTGHAEAVEVSYDPAQVSYGTLLQIFFSVAHDPTQLDRQGPDVGPQYRSAIFPSGPAQAKVAQAYIAQLDAARLFGRPIATRIENASGFFPAEVYHQDFMTEHPQHPYIVVNDLPKVKQLERLFPERFRAEPVLVKRAR
ncbi:peptide-methionine (S)-S-oxide reductase MsrA [Piscinibacter sp.]|uniref:peptide-methionine (S)-S-oxide reductase MsrA n=1 Tax=Piscinibacter sp. TaxID=1903157 RepID=UPI0039E4605B